MITAPELLIALFICALVFPIDYGISRWIKHRHERGIDRELEKLFSEERS